MAISQSLDSPFKRNQQRKHVLTLGAAALAIILIVGFFFFYLRSQKAGILVLDPASSIIIKVNGQTANPEQTSRGIFVPLYAGRYRLELDKSGYTPFTKDITTVPGTILEIRPAFTLLPAVQQSSGDSIDYVRPSADESYVYYLGNFRQRLFRLNVSTQETLPLTDQPLRNVVDVEWGTDPNVALVVQTDGTYLQEIPLYNFETQTYLKVAGPDFISPVWDPNNPDRIAAAYFPSSGEKSLIVSDKRFSTVTRLESLENIPNPKVIWSPDSNYILMVARSNTYSQQNAWLYTLASGNLQQITTSGGITDAKFSTDSSHILLQQNSQVGAISREVETVSSGAIQSISGSTPVSQTAWKDGTSFYEASSDLQSLILLNITGTSQSTPLSLPTNEALESLYYFAKPDKVIIATHAAVYTVNLQKQ